MVDDYEKKDGDTKHVGKDGELDVGDHFGSIRRRSFYLLSKDLKVKTDFELNG